MNSGISLHQSDVLWVCACDKQLQLALQPHTPAWLTCTETASCSMFTVGVGFMEPEGADDDVMSIPILTQHAVIIHHQSNQQHHQRQQQQQKQQQQQTQQRHKPQDQEHKQVHITQPSIRMESYCCE